MQTDTTAENDPPESVALILSEHAASCGTCAAGEECDEADALIVELLEIEPWPFELGRES